MSFSCLGCIRGRRGNRLVYLVLWGRVKWQTKPTAVYRDINKGTTTKKKNSYRAFNNIPQRKLQANCKQNANNLQAKVAAFPFYCHKALLLDCILCPVNKPFTIVVGWMKLRPFPYMAGPFNHQGANEQWNFTGFLGLLCPLVWNIISQWTLVTGILTQFPAAPVL